MSEIAPSQPDSPLTAWIKTNLGSLYESAIGGETDFQTTFNSTFSEKVSIHLNHEQISRDDFESNMTTSRSALSRSSTIEWKDILEIPTKSEEGASTSGVGYYRFHIMKICPLLLPPVTALRHRRWVFRCYKIIKVQDPRFGCTKPQL